jgi:hypothetical protein
MRAASCACVKPVALRASTWTQIRVRWRLERRVAKRAVPAGAKAPLTTAAFIKGEIKKGKLGDLQILTSARKRAPKQKIGNGYVA